MTDAPDHPAPGPSLLTRIGGILVSREEIATALSKLEQSTRSHIGPRLDAIQSPLAQTEFRKLADRYMHRYPDDDNYHAVVPDRERATPRLKAFICLLRRELAALDNEAAIAEQVWHAEDALPPPDAEDARKRTLAEIIRREGQSAFKAKLVRAYNGCCAVTGCDELGAFEAAHIHPYQGPDWNKVQNGLLLRGDIHTLFDRHLLGIDPQTRKVVLSLQLSGEHYRALDGHPVADPAEEGQRPSQEVLKNAGRSSAGNRHFSPSRRRPTRGTRDGDLGCALVYMHFAQQFDREPGRRHSPGNRFMGVFHLS